MDKNLYRGTIKGKAAAGKPALWLAAAVALALFSGCRVTYHASHEHTPVFVTHIFSDQDYDGDIAFSPPATYIVSSARTTGTVLAGIDPIYADEFRGFLDFPLRGGHGLPVHAGIESATLEIFISSVVTAFPGDTVPLIIDLVAFQPPALIASDFDRLSQPPLMSLAFDIAAADTGTTVVIDVTSMMIEAQREDLPDFQVRFLLDDVAASGLVEIEDSVLQTAPMLTVSYF